MRYLSVCSGIEAASVAWEPLGWKPAGFSETEPFPSAVLRNRFPGVQNFGDMTKYMEWPVRQGDFDLLVGGTPCQAFSVAGLRKGLNDPRGNLTLVFLGMIAHFMPKFVVWENVPGVISDGTGAFDAFLQGLNGIGYVFDTDILDAQFFGVPQRRRRVFVVAIRADYVNDNFDIGVDYERPADGELFSVKDLLHGEPDGLGQAADKIKLVVGAASFGRRGAAKVPPFTAVVRGNLAPGGVEGNDCPSGAFGRAERNSCIAIEGNGTRPSHKGTGISDSGTMYTLNATEVHGICVLKAVDIRHTKENGDVVQTLLSKPSGGWSLYSASAVRSGNVIRRLTPVEYERLQGFPDDWTKIPWKGKQAMYCPDTPRYKALGNSMAVPVMRYIGTRIQFLEDMLRTYRKYI